MQPFLKKTAENHTYASETSSSAKIGGQRHRDSGDSAVSTCSEATRRNWKRLHTSEQGRLTGRANKRRSEKKIVPKEYFSHEENIETVKQWLTEVQAMSFPAGDVVFSVGVGLLKKAGLWEKEHVRLSVGNQPFTLAEEIVSHSLPENERDLPGIVYQCLQSEGVKNRNGSYYTPESLTNLMMKGIVLSAGQSFLDPCCGSGAFLLSVEGAEPSQLFGMDSDPVAVMAARINLLLRYPDQVFLPQVFCGDFLSDGAAESCFGDRKFDIVVTNPPWGSAFHGESFSAFFRRAFSLLKPEGVSRFLFPDAVRNVRLHSELRRFWLQDVRLEELREYSTGFTGVTTGCISVTCRNSRPSTNLRWIREQEEAEIPLSRFRLTRHHVLSFLNEQDERIIRTVQQRGVYTLSESEWGLGIVTGDNRRLLSEEPSEETEPIYRGKEIQPYQIMEACRFIRSDRSRFQQAAPETLYRAPEKLVYRFIADRPVFAYDNRQRLLLNSANLLIPHISGSGIKTVMAFLNSDLYGFLYRRLFGEIKLLQGNLCELPFPALTAEQDRELTALADCVMQGSAGAREQLEIRICQLCGLNEEQISYVRAQFSDG